MDGVLAQQKEKAAVAPARAGFFRRHFRKLAILGATFAVAGILYYGVPAYLDKAKDDKIRPRVELLMHQADSLTHGQKKPTFGDCREFLEIGASLRLTAGDMLALMEIRDTVNMRGSAIDSLKAAFDGETLTLKRVYQTLKLFPMWLRHAPGGAGSEYEKSIVAYFEEIDREFGKIIRGHDGNGERKEAHQYTRMRELVKTAVRILPKSDCGEELRRKITEGEQN